MIFFELPIIRAAQSNLVLGSSFRFNISEKGGCVNTLDCPPCLMSVKVQYASFKSLYQLTMLFLEVNKQLITYDPYSKSPILPLSVALLAEVSYKPEGNLVVCWASLFVS
jgi:hypothetical protein